MKLELARKGLVVGIPKHRTKHVHSKTHHYSKRHTKISNNTQRYQDTEQALIETSEESDDSNHSPMKQMKGKTQTFIVNKRNI